MTPNSLDPEIRLAVEAAQDKQALDISVLNLRGSGAFADYFLLCSGTSQPQIQAIGEAIEEKLGRRGRHVAHREGKSSAEWVLLDYGYFGVHIFSASITISNASGVMPSAWIFTNRRTPERRQAALQNLTVVRTASPATSPKATSRNNDRVIQFVAQPLLAVLFAFAIADIQQSL